LYESGRVDKIPRSILSAFEDLIKDLKQWQYNLTIHFIL
jgi:hypothetical protein